MPDIAWVFGFPAAGLGQVGDRPPGVAELAACTSIVDQQLDSLDPGVLVEVEQGGRFRVGERPHYPHDHIRFKLALSFVVAALQLVLRLQAQLCGQSVEAESSRWPTRCWRSGRRIR